METSDEQLSNVNIKKEGGIEEAKDCLMVNFANKYIGGECMELGTSQEEVLFLIFPEFYFCLLLFPKMLHNEAIVVRGLKRYSKYKGNDEDLEFTEEYKEGCQLGEDNILERTFTCIDALRFDEAEKKYQFDKNVILLELNKAYVGFQGSSLEKDKYEKMPVSTGNWGCGELGINVELKFLIQWISATRNGRDIEYFIFNSDRTIYLQDIVTTYQNKTVKEVYKDLIEI